MFQGVDNRFQPIVNLQLLQNVANVVSDRRGGDGERAGDVVGAESLGQQG